MAMLSTSHDSSYKHKNKKKPNRNVCDFDSHISFHFLYAVTIQRNLISMSKLNLVLTWLGSVWRATVYISLKCDANSQNSFWANFLLLFLYVECALCASVVCRVHAVLRCTLC